MKPLLNMLVLAVLFVIPYTATSNPALSIHDLTNLSGQQYQVSGRDPYVVFPDLDKTQANDTGVVFELRLVDAKRASNPSAQIHWSDDKNQFDNKNHISTQLNSGPNKFVIPFEQVAIPTSRFRIDIERCSNCIVEIKQPVWVKQIPIDATLPSGLSSFLRLYHGYDLDISDWGGKELIKSAPANFSFKGWDPRIINQTPLNIPSHMASGIYFEFDYNGENEYQTYELFWVLTGLKTSALRSAHFLLPNDGDSRKQVFLPFNRIHSTRNIEHLRLDFEACEKCIFKLTRSRIVGTNEFELYQPYIPERLYYIHTERPPASLVKSQIKNKLMHDWLFILFWVGFMLLVSGFTVKKLIAKPN